MTELTILMPCLNEAETIETCIRKAKGFLERSGISGEIVIADNGSTDGSQAMAEALGARVVDVPVKGYGAALGAGIAAARGRYIIMGDSDDSYDFSRLDTFVESCAAAPTSSWATVSRAGSRPAPCRPCTAISAIRFFRPSGACSSARRSVTSIAACAGFRGRRSSGSSSTRRGWSSPPKW
jgi:glycosyltransferase involved in cell wall biosynthesis